MESLKQLMQFMSLGQRVDLKLVALAHSLSLTGSVEGKALIFSVEDFLLALMKLTTDVDVCVGNKATVCLINLTSEKPEAGKIFEIANRPDPPFPIVSEAVRNILNENSFLADPWSMVLSNLTRNTANLPAIIATLEEDETTLLRLGNAYTKLDYNKKGGHLNYLGSIFGNITQNKRGREVICLPKYNLLEKIILFTSYQESVLRRGGAIGLLKNLCRDQTCHEAVLSADDDTLCALLKPLCGPEEFSDEENDKFPLDLQYLPDTTERETDPGLRRLLVNCLLQLCAKRCFRELLRAKGVYEILREYHKWETSTGGNSECVLACENVVDILIKKEEEIGLDNYRDVEVPPATAAKFKEDDEAYLKSLRDAREK